jgi:tRNA threonylcarbamoyladenosine biosynthesis protein TsaE
MKSFSVLSRSTTQTQAWGRRVGRLLKGGEIIGLSGELGSGKTCFVRGLAQGLEVDKKAWVRSPSFTLINEYDGRLPLYHIDLYRLEGVNEIEELNLREVLFSEGVSVIEWVERLPEAEIDELLGVAFSHGKGSQRQLDFTANGSHYEEIINQLKRRK